MVVAAACVCSRMTDGNNSADAADNAAAEWNDALLFEVAVDPFQKIAISGKEDGRASGLRDGYLEGVNIGRSKGWEIGLELGYVDNFARGILEGYRERLQQHQHQNEISISSTASSQTNQDTSQNTSAPRISHRLERCLTLARDLVKMVGEFPDPDSLLSQNHGDEVDTRVEMGNEIDETHTREDTHTAIGDCSAREDNRFTTKSTDACCESSSPLESTNSNEHNDTDDLVEGLNFGTTSKVETHNVKTMVDVSSWIERIRAKFKLLCVLLKTKQSFDLKRVLELGDLGLSDTPPKEKEEDADTKVEVTEPISMNTKSQERINTTDQDSPAIESDW